MPWGDRTGPWGAGPMTGRGLGYCAGYPTPGYLNPVGYGFRGRGYGFGRRGRGRGFRGWGRGWGVPYAPWTAGYPAAYLPYPTAYPAVYPY